MSEPVPIALAITIIGGLLYLALLPRTDKPSPVLQRVAEMGRIAFGIGLLCWALLLTRAALG